MTKYLVTVGESRLLVQAGSMGEAARIGVQRRIEAGAEAELPDWIEVIEIRGWPIHLRTDGILAHVLSAARRRSNGTGTQ